MAKIYRYELQVFFANHWHSRGHYYTRKDAWADRCNMRKKGDEYGSFKHRVILSSKPYITD